MRDMNDYPRLLILGNSCLSKTNSNGRTLLNFLQGWPSDKLAQFYVKDQRPDFSVCKNYFRVTDNQALHAFLGKKAKATVFTDSACTAQPPSISEKTNRRNPITMFLREAVWNTGRWQRCGFTQWVEAFSPQILLLQAGDCGFMLRLARTLAKKYNIPLVIYNSEGYYFKNHNYFRCSAIPGWFYPFFHRYFRKELSRAIQRAACSIYINQDLKCVYDQEFSLPSVCIYTATEIQPKKYHPANTPPRVSYLGNMGVGRHEQLVELATVLQNVCPEAHLDIYGKLPTNKVKQSFDACNGIRYKGVISYEDVLQVMTESDVLVHVENFSEFYRKDSKYAFSTKIADCLACGTCFLLYAPKELCCTKYLQDNEASYVATDKAQLEHLLKEIFASEAARSRYLDQAAALAAKNHSSVKNAHAFQRILLDTWQEAEKKRIHHE